MIGIFYALICLLNVIKLIFNMWMSHEKWHFWDLNMGHVHTKRYHYDIDFSSSIYMNDSMVMSNSNIFFHVAYKTWNVSLLDYFSLSKLLCM